jgi:hypothetical protein
MTLDFLVLAPIPKGGEAFGATIVSASASMLFDVGARFSVKMDSISIRDTASHYEDTILATISGSKDGNAWGNKAWLGDHNNTDRGLHVDLGEYAAFDAVMGEPWCRN